MEGEFPDRSQADSAALQVCPNSSPFLRLHFPFQRTVVKDRALGGGKGGWKSCVTFNQRPGFKSCIRFLISGDVILVGQVTGTFSLNLLILKMVT